MSLELAQAMLDMPRTRSMHVILEEHHNSFIWDDHGDEVSQWNAMAGTAARHEDVQALHDDDGRPWFTYKGS